MIEEVSSNVELILVGDSLQSAMKRLRFEVVQSLHIRMNGSQLIHGGWSNAL